MPLNAAGKPDHRKLPASVIRLYRLCHCKPRRKADRGKQPVHGQEQKEEASGSASGPSLSAMFSAQNIRTTPAGSPGAATDTPLPLPSCPPSSATPPEICKANFFIEVPALPQTSKLATLASHVAPEAAGPMLSPILSPVPSTSRTPLFLPTFTPPTPFPTPPPLCLPLSPHIPSPPRWELPPFFPMRDHPVVSTAPPFSRSPAPERTSKPAPTFKRTSEPAPAPEGTARSAPAPEPASAPELALSAPSAPSTSAAADFASRVKLLEKRVAEAEEWMCATDDWKCQVEERLKARGI